MRTPIGRRSLAAALGLTAAVSVAVSLAACSSSGSSAGSTKSGGAKAAAGRTYTVWDPYPQYDAASAWGRLVAKCGTDNGVKVKRTGWDTTKLTSQVLLGAQQGNAPSVLIVDNPVVSTLASGGVLSDTKTTGQITDGYAANILDAGKVDGKMYGVPIGANTLALYYNKSVLSQAGIDIGSVKDWASLTAALAKAKAAGKKGITFSAVNTEEGSFQFLPWFWGSGAKLTKLDSDGGVAALQLWSDWLKHGYAPSDVINNNQQSSFQEFLTGNYAFAENGTWQLGTLKGSKIDWGVVPIPARSGGVAAAPTGGEFVTVPKQKDSGKLKTAAKIADCLASPANAFTVDNTLNYVSAIADVQQKQVQANPLLTEWVTAVNAAKGRTGDNLGTKYPKISEPMWNAVQAGLSGSKSPKQAMHDAQQQAGS
jgi:multiple sugar transport system substrate-binding protein